MPFGKYRGWEITTLPDDYLSWLTTIELRGWLFNAVHREYDRRTWGYEYPEEERAPSSVFGLRIRPEDLAMAQKLFAAGYRTLARTMHPDAGGDVAAMQRLNAFADSIRTQLRALEEAR
jgi:hypothetical protein